MFKKGFTLIELLIVITIIAILASIGLVSYSSFLKNSRNSKRQSDLKIIQSAVEEYYADQLYYPGDGDVISGSSLQYTNTDNPPQTKTYLNKVPNDPKQASYIYKQTGCGSTGNDYCLGANMEGNPPASDPNCPKSGTLSGGVNYCVTRP